MSQLFIRQDLIKTLPQIDALLFDIDGVLLDVSGSFRVAIAQTTQFYAVHTLGLESNGALIEGEDIEKFKFVGGFNDDWDLTCAALAYVIAVWAQTGAPDTATLRQNLNWDGFTDAIRRRGGGLQNAEGWVLEELTPTQRREFARSWNTRAITRLFQEFYGGDDACRDLYGFEPTTVHGPGLYREEKVLLDTEHLPPNIKLGVVTGRSNAETRLALRQCHLLNRIPEQNWITPERGAKKPDARTLTLAQEALNFKFAVFVGDILDDLNTVLNYRETRASGKAKIASAIALSGPGGAKHEREFLERGADIITPDVNFFLQYLRGVLGKSV